MKKYQSLISYSVAILILMTLYLATSSQMTGSDLSGRLLAAGPHMSQMDLTVIVTFLVTRVLVMVFLIPAIGYRLTLALFDKYLCKQ